MSLPRRLPVPALLAGALAIVFAGACSRTEPTPTAAAAPAAASAPEAGKPTLGTFGFDTAGMDRSVMPGDNFFDYASGQWVAKTEIPADRSSYSSFTLLTENALARTRAIIDESASDKSVSGEARKIGDYYNAFMDFWNYLWWLGS